MLCLYCGKKSDDSSLFYLSSKTKCKECTKKSVSENRQKNLEKIRAYDRLRGALPHRVKARIDYQNTAAYKVSHTKSTNIYRFNNKKKTAAHNAISKAILRGKIIPWPVCAVPECECVKLEAHHSDYDRPLDVVWLCNAHHRDIHEMI